MIFLSDSFWDCLGNADFKDSSRFDQLNMVRLSYRYQPVFRDVSGGSLEWEWEVRVADEFVLRKFGDPSKWWHRDAYPFTWVGSNKQGTKTRNGVLQPGFLHSIAGVEHKPPRYVSKGRIFLRISAEDPWPHLLNLAETIGYIPKRKVSG